MSLSSTLSPCDKHIHCRFLPVINQYNGFVRLAFRHILKMLQLKAGAQILQMNHELSEKNMTITLAGIRLKRKTSTD